jgi:flavin-binding protein dodecin
MHVTVQGCLGVVKTVLDLVRRVLIRKRTGGHMSDIAKVVTVIGSSPESFAKAADAAVQEAAKTVRGIKGADVISMSANVEDGRITTYKTTVNIAFAVER